MYIRRAEPTAAGTVSEYPEVPDAQQSVGQRAGAIEDQHSWPTTGVGRDRGLAAPLGLPPLHPHSLVALPPVRFPPVDDDGEFSLRGDLAKG